MKLNLLFFIPLLSLSCCVSKKAKNDLDKANLKGDIASLKTETFDAYQQGSEILVLGADEIYQVRYNKQGFIIDLNLDHGGSVENMKYNYGPDGKLLNISATKLAKDTIANNATHYTYAYTFSPDKLSSEENLYLNGQLFRVSKLIYNDNGKAITNSVFDAHNKLYSKDSFEYSYSGLLKASTHSDEGTTFSTKTFYTYDGNGDIVSVNTHLNKNNTQAVTSFKYDNYDDADNWRTRLSYQNGKLNKLTKRSITYY